MFHVPPAICAGCVTGQVGLCAGLAPDQVAKIASIARPISVRKFQKIAGRSGAPATALVIRSGTVKLCHTLADGRHQIIDFLQSGDIAIRHTAETQLAQSFETSTDVALCEIVLAELESVCRDSPEINRTVVGVALAQIERKNDHVLLLGRKRAGERVASFLLDMSARAARRGESGTRLALPMSRGEIADYLSLTPETVSRAFTVLREQQIIDLPHPSEINILAMSRLREIADGADALVVR